MSSILRSRMISLELPSSSARPEALRRGVGRSCGPNPAGAVPLHMTLCSNQATSKAARAPAGPSVILCSSLNKERKKLAKVLKSHRKVLEKRLSALHVTDVDSPVLSELLCELRSLRAQLESQRASGLIHAADSDSSSDSDADECVTRSLASARRVCARQPVAQHPLSTIAFPAAHADAVPSPASFDAGACIGAPTSNASDSAAAGSAATRNTMVISGLDGQLEVAVPEPQEGWEWDEATFRAAQFPGVGGRVMVCTGSKCQRKGATEVLHAVSALAAGNPAIEVVPCKCVGKCSAGAALRVRPAGQSCATYTQVRPAELPDVFNEHFGEAPTAQQASPLAVPPVGLSHGAETGAAAAAVAAAVADCALELPAGVAPGVHCCVECTREDAEMV